MLRWFHWTYTDILDISNPNNEDENLIMIGGIAGEEVRKFGQNLKSFLE